MKGEQGENEHIVEKQFAIAVRRLVAETLHMLFEQPDILSANNGLMPVPQRGLVGIGRWRRRSTRHGSRS